MRVAEVRYRAGVRVYVVAAALAGDRLDGRLLGVVEQRTGDELRTFCAESRLVLHLGQQVLVKMVDQLVAELNEALQTARCDFDELREKKTHKYTQN